MRLQIHRLLTSVQVHVEFMKKTMLASSKYVVVNISYRSVMMGCDMMDAFEGNDYSNLCIIHFVIVRSQQHSDCSNLLIITFCEGVFCLTVTETAFVTIILLPGWETLQHKASVCMPSIQKLQFCIHCSSWCLMHAYKVHTFDSCYIKYCTVNTLQFDYGQK